MSVTVCARVGREARVRVYVGLCEAGRLIMKQAQPESSLQDDP